MGEVLSGCLPVVRRGGENVPSGVAGAVRPCRVEGHPHDGGAVMMGHPFGLAVLEVVSGPPAQFL